MSRPRKEVGIRRRRHGWRVFAKVHGKVYTCPQFPLATPIGELRAARDRLIAQYGGVPLTAGSLAADVAGYLARPEVAAKPSAPQMARMLAQWLAELGYERSRHAVTTADVETVIQKWLRTYAPVTVYHRRTVLNRLYHVLGSDHDRYNPVTKTTNPDHYRPEDRSVDFATIARILEAMPADRSIAPGIRRPSLSRLRAALIAWTGIPPAELQKLGPQHFDRHAGFVRMPWRDKGEGTPAHRRELSAEGVAAFVALDAAGGWGRFQPEALSKAFKRAARRVCGPSTAIRLYDLRHSLGADTYRLTGDLETVRRTLGHAEGSPITARYAMGAHAEVDRAALAAVSAHRAARVAAAFPAHRLPARLPAARKRLKQKTLLRVI